MANTSSSSTIDIENTPISPTYYHYNLQLPPPLLPTPKHHLLPSTNGDLKTYLLTPISPSSRLTSILLLLLALATGINDAATFIDYHLFVSNQTGNTVFLGIGALSNDTIFDLRHVGLSLGGFCIGGLVTGQIATFFTSKRARWWVTLNNGTQTVMTFAAAALRCWYALDDSSAVNSGAPRNYSVIALLAVASGMQVAMARGLGVTEIPTGMITSAWIDLMADEKIWYFWRTNRPRDRRLGFVLCILVGGFIGAAAHVYCTPALPLLLAGLLKVVVTLGFVVGRGEESEQKEKVEEGKVVNALSGKWEAAKSPTI